MNRPAFSTQSVFHFDDTREETTMNDQALQSYLLTIRADVSDPRALTLEVARIKSILLHIQKQKMPVTYVEWEAFKKRVYHIQLTAFSRGWPALLRECNSVADCLRWLWEWNHDSSWPDTSGDVEQ